MKKRIISLATLGFWLSAFFINIVQPAFAQDWEKLGADLDGDGLVNEVEIAGWYNQAGGPFYTDPLDADSDDDGLNDGEEKLFDTNPVNYRSPGLYVWYKPEYATKKYFRTEAQNPPDPYNPNRYAYLLMKQAADKTLITEAMIARRGATLQFGGPISGTLSITGPGLDTLTPQKDVYGGGWKVVLPSTTNGTTGIYTATVSIPGQQPLTMPVYVIFELPSQLTQSQIDAYVYNDNLADLRDETGVVWRIHNDTYIKDSFTYRISHSYAQAFWTDHYKKFVFVDRVMPRMQGRRTQLAAANALAQGADEEVRVKYSNYLRTDMETTLRTTWDGTGWTQVGSPCQNQAGTITGFLRAAGIPAQPFIIDWTSVNSYDTSVRVWLNNNWYGIRSYTGGEDENNTWANYYPFSRGANGYTPATILSNWDNAGSYRESSGNVLVGVNEGWDYERWRNKNPGETCPLGESRYGEQCFEGGTVGTRWSPDAHMIEQSREHRWVGRWPLEFELKSPYVDSLSSLIWKGDSYLPDQWPDRYVLPDPYPTPPGISENWPYEPVPRGCPPGFLGTCPYGTGVLQALDETVQPSAPKPVVLVQSNQIQIGHIMRDYGVDENGNGRFDKLVVAVEVTVVKPGAYTMGGLLAIPDGFTPYGNINANNVTVNLAQGAQIVELSFEGLAIGNARANGPYTISNLWITDLPEFDPRLGPWDKVLAAQEPNQTTTAYQFNQFESAGAFLTDKYNHRGIDNNGDGLVETLSVSVPLQIITPETFTVEGDLYDSQNNFVDHLTWSGSGPTAELAFDIRRTSPPYRLENVRLFDAKGSLLDSRSKDVYTISDAGGPIDQGVISLEVYSSAAGDGLSSLDVKPTLVFTDRGVDLNGNGLFDQLIVGVEVNVTAPHGNDQYRVEGWLASPDGSLVVYGISQPTFLSTGIQKLSLPFNARAITGQGITGPYRLMALRILGSSAYNVLDEVNVTNLQLNYGLNTLESDTKVATLFSDNLENGSGKWQSQTPWNLAQKAHPAASYVWEATSGSNSNLRLANPLNLASYVNPVLRFQNTYQMTSSSDKAFVQVSANGVSWTKVATFTNSTDRWETRIIDLSNFAKTPGLNLQFSGNFSSFVWNIDNIIVTGLPGIASVSFDYSPKPVKAGENILLVGSYTSIDTTLPVTYTWDFGDGSAPATGALVTHQFPAGDFPVKLTVTTPHDSMSFSQIISSGNPVTGTSFTYQPQNPETTHVISFTAAYQPITATNTITHPIVYSWNFGDGATITTTKKVITHTYNTGGSYPVHLSTSNGYGTAASNQTVVVKEGVGGVTFTPSGTLIEDDPTTFNTQITPATASQPITYTWRFGDGSPPTTTTSTTINHTFNTPAAYTVWITANNGYGSPAVYSNTVIITGRPVITAAFTFAQTQAHADREAAFNASYGPANATQPVTYTWNFNDGSSISSTPNPIITHVFPAMPISGTWTVQLSVSNGHGVPATYSLPVTLPFDNDGDGLSNWYEWNQSHTDPNNSDSDGDGLTDGQEVKIHTNPNSKDTDGDGIPDNIEVGPDPANPYDSDSDSPNPDGIIDALDLDSDNDGIPDAAEWDTDEDASPTDDLCSNLNLDTDGDGIPNCQDNNADGDNLPNYRDPDTDGDGFLDLVEGTGDDDEDGIPNFLDSDPVSNRPANSVYLPIIMRSFSN